MRKITINHYLNKSLKPKIEGNKELYPLYVQIIANRTNYRLKSNFPFNDGYLREADLMQDFVIKSNEAESKELEKIVNYLLDSNKLNLLTAETVKRYSESLWDVVNRNFGILFDKESEVLPYSFPSPLMNRGFFDINEILIFTESEIEIKFSENYRYCKKGVESIYMGLVNPDFKELELLKLTVFDYLYGDGSKKVLQAVKMNNCIVASDSESEYQNILEEITKLIGL